MTLPAGQAIGRYQILEELGRGGMAFVYKALDTRLNRLVAIKVIRRTAFLDEHYEAMIRRFEREARSLAILDHPHIVKVFDYGEQEGSPYLVMQFLAGGSLKDLVRSTQSPPDWCEAVRLCIPVARALAYAHRQGIVHRDVKPANILLSVQGEPMLSDFGIAKILHTGEGALTGSGVSIGTPEYMAPEQAMGNVVAQSDIYSLGIVLFELVTGQRPFTADTPMAVMLKHIQEPIPDVRVFNATLPEELARILEKACAKQPAARFASADEFADALERLVSRDEMTKTSAIPEITEAETVIVKAPKAVPPAVPARFPLRGWLRFALPGVAAILVFLIVFFIVNGRSGGELSAFPTLTTAVHVSASATSSPILSSPTATMSPTEARTPTVSVQTMRLELPIPVVKEEITAKNASLIAELSSMTIGHIYQLEYSSDGRYLALLVPEGVYLYNIETKEVHFIRPMAQTSVFALSPGSSQLLTAGTNHGVLSFWRVEDDSLWTEIDLGVDGVRAVAFSPDSMLVAASTADNTIQLYAPYSRQKVTTMKGHQDDIWGLDFSPDGSLLASASDDKSVRVWSVPTGLQLGIMVGHENAVVDVAFSPDGTKLASASWDKTVWLWNIPQNTPAHFLTGHSDWVRSVAFSPDGSLLASGGDDDTLRLWSVSDGTLLKTLVGHGDDVHSVTFSPDGRLLVSTSRDGTIRMWGIGR